MSDGNYNRNLLPYNNYRSGLKAGQAQMRTQAIEAFKAWYQDAMPEASPSEAEQALLQFKAHLHKGETL